MAGWKLVTVEDVHVAKAQTVLQQTLEQLLTGLGAGDRRVTPGTATRGTSIVADAGRYTVDVCTTGGARS